MDDGLLAAELDLDGLTAREWLVSNGVGGYASSTVAAMNTRRYHGLLVAAMAPPVRRMVLLSRAEETLVCDGREFYLACNDYPGAVWPHGHDHLQAFSTHPFPRWGYQGDGWTLEKQLRLLRGENTVLLTYTLWGGMTGADLELRPLLALRGIHDLGRQWDGRLQAEPRSKGHYRVAATSRTPEVFFAHDGTFDRKPCWYYSTIYRRELERGYPGEEDLWCPGVVRIRLRPGQTAHFACSADPIELSQVIGRSGRQLAPVGAPRPTFFPAAGEVAPAASDADLEILVRATEPFVLASRQGESPGGTISYPWHAPSPRAALAGFAGLYLIPGRLADARSLLLALLPRLDNGLLPSEFPEDGTEPVYHGADVSLWFVNAVYEYLAYTGDAPTVGRHLADAVFMILDHYRRGTGLGIRADDDGLLVSETAGVGTTWMDAQIDGVPVTPRGGRAVDVNALWYNAARVGAELARRFGSAARAADYAALAATIRDAFNRRFWNEAGGYCFDVVGDDAPDAAVRPNQLLAASLPFPVLTADRVAKVMDVVRRELLTPYGVRTLSPRDPGYCRQAGGDEAGRERARHCGSAHPWLLGPFVTAFLRVRGRSAAAVNEAATLLRPCLDRLRHEGMGLLCELFDGDSPQAPGGAVASPLAAAELLRCYVQNVLGREPVLPSVGSSEPVISPVPAAPNVAHPA